MEFSDGGRAGPNSAPGGAARATGDHVGGVIREPLPEIVRKPIRVIAEAIVSKGSCNTRRATQRLDGKKERFAAGCVEFSCDCHGQGELSDWS